MTEVTKKQKENSISYFMKAKAEKKFNPWESSTFPSSQSQYNKPGLPKKWHEIVDLCKFFYEREGIIRTVVDKQVEIAINGLSIVFPENEPKEAEVFYYIKNKLRGFLSQAATEYFLSGLIVSGTVWQQVDTEQTGLENNYIVPSDLWVRNPDNINLRATPIPSRVIPIWQVPNSTVTLIQNKGKYSDGVEDIKTYNMLKKYFPEFVNKVQKGETKIPLQDSFVIRRKPVLRTQYPIPYLMPVLELLIHKRNLRKMDYAIASRVINAILHVKIGSDEYPITIDDQDILDDLEREFRRRGSANNYERIVEFFTNHTVEIDWVTPNIDVLLNSDKYTELNQEILYGLGFPKFLITGEKERSNSGSTGSALLSPLNTMRAMRNDFIGLLNKIFREIAKRNNLDTVPKVTFDPLNLVDLSDLIQISQEMYNKNIVSGSSLAKLAGFDFNQEQYLIKRDKNLQSELFGEDLYEDNNDNQQDQDTEEET
jgi:hypothetical protein